ncbi:MAG: RNA 2',3'-cyclic phosphodiesterase [Blautia sp.]|nr:RNA 2',3'-cyclic phosphodiesterase [Blautia sp.]
MRVFLALQLSEEMKKALIGTMHDMKQQGIKGNYVPMQNFHITLAFVGQTQMIDEIRQVMDSIPIEKSRLSFSDFGYTGDVFWIGVKGNQKIKKYVSDLRKRLKEKGIPCDDAKFEPHVTLIRQQKGKRPAGLAIPKADMTVTRVSLMKSEEKDGKRIYKEIYAVE